MKKVYFLLILLSGYFGFSQNQYPTAKGSHMDLDGGTIRMIKPSITGGWARGFHYRNETNNNNYAGIGILGSGETPKYLFMGHGTSPWSSGKGLYVLPNGNVGVGIIDPEEKLHVKGDVKFSRLTGGANFIKINSDAGGNYITGDDPGTNQKHLFIQVSPTGPGKTDRHLYFRAGKTANGDLITRMVIKGNGNVGIGTTSPGNWKLAVNGNIRAKEIKVETGWSDFVFKEDYHLPTLEEVEQHINEKGHLKDIPSAKEVVENGIFLGEMDAKLLQKIEELTLYTIQQQKQIEKQQKQVEAVLKQNKKLQQEINRLKNK